MNDLEASKRLAYVLRHRPDSIGLTLDSQGWVAVDALLAALGHETPEFSREQLERLVHVEGKRRYAFSSDGERVRALQGHSVPVELGHPRCAPPARLFHGSATRFSDAIEAEGLRPGARHHVHLSTDAETAAIVGARHGDLALFEIDAGRMQSDGFAFFVAPNGVWLVEAVPPDYLLRVR